MRAITAAIAIALLTTTAEAKINPRYEFCGDRYCGHYEVIRYGLLSKVRKNKQANRQKVYLPSLQKEKNLAVPLPRPKPKSLSHYAQTEFDGVKFTVDLVAKARKFLGTNPTGWSSLWCGRFMAMIAPHAAKKIGNANLAINWTKLPKTTPRIGAILVTRRNGGSGHVGVVIGFKNGNPVTISGNHNRKVGIGVYPKHRIIAYVSA